MKVFKILPVVIILLFSNSCRKKPENEIADKMKGIAVVDIYNIGIEKLLNRKFFTARKTLEIIIDNAADSRYFSKAKLAIADSYFFDPSTGASDALAEYKSYLIYFPNSEGADYAQFMTAMCYYTQITTPDRDQSFSLKAIEEFNKVKANYPDSQYVKMADEKIKACWQRIALHEFLVGQFYYKAKSYLAAQRRLEDLLEKYPEYIDLEQTYYLYGRSLFEVKRFDDAARYYRKLLEEYPDTIFKDQISKELRDIDSGLVFEQQKKDIEKFVEKMKKQNETIDDDKEDNENDGNSDK